MTVPSRELLRAFTAIIAQYCCSCGEPWLFGCTKLHEHSPYDDCYDYADARQFWCGCYGHKECEKSGNVCRQHGRAPEAYWACYGSGLARLGAPARYRLFGAALTILNSEADASITATPEA